MVSERMDSSGHKEATPESGSAPLGGSSDNAGKPRIGWDDPAVPVGNAPPRPRWPVVVSGIAWLAWFGFLFAMMLERMRDSAP